MGQIKTRPTLKGYFETGNIPSQAQYGDLIDSNLNLADTGVQIVPGTLSSSICSSGNYTGVSASLDYLTTTGNISASGTSHIFGGNIIASSLIGDCFGNSTGLTGSPNILVTHITASGNISSSIGTGSFGSLVVDGSSVDFTNLPTSDPGIVGRLYNDSGTIKISL